MSRDLTTEETTTAIMYHRVNDPFLGALCPSKSGLMNKHIVKHIVSHCNKHIVKHSNVKCFIFGALYPSKFGLIGIYTK